MNNLRKVTTYDRMRALNLRGSDLCVYAAFASLDEKVRALLKDVRLARPGGGN